MLSVDGLFLENGDNLIFEDERQLSAFLEYVFSAKSAWIPPGRNNGRTTAHRERFCLRYFLSEEAERFRYPIAVEKTERPDFIVTDKTGLRIGVEHTDAGPEAFQRWLAQTEGQERRFRFLPDKDEREELDGTAGEDDVRFDDAAADIVAALLHKLESVNKFGYQDADSYVLLIYLLSNRLLSGDGGLEQIFARLPKLDHVGTLDAGAKRFDRVLVILNNEARFWT